MAAEFEAVPAGRFAAPDPAAAEFNLSNSLHRR
jgi:hypothetical protein